MLIYKDVGRSNIHCRDSMNLMKKENIDFLFLITKKLWIRPTGETTLKKNAPSALPPGWCGKECDL